jgi:hypothetical protein
MSSGIGPAVSSSWSSSTDHLGQLRKGQVVSPDWTLVSPEALWAVAVTARAGHGSGFVSVSAAVLLTPLEFARRSD